MAFRACPLQRTTFPVVLKLFRLIHLALHVSFIRGRKTAWARVDGGRLIKHGYGLVFGVETAPSCITVERAWKTDNNSMSFVRQEVLGFWLSKFFAKAFSVQNEEAGKTKSINYIDAVTNRNQWEVFFWVIFWWVMVCWVILKIVNKKLVPEKSSKVGKFKKAENHPEFFSFLVKDLLF